MSGSILLALRERERETMKAIIKSLSYCPIAVGQCPVYSMVMSNSGFYDNSYHDN